MEKYRKVKMIGKGNFGYALLVQNVQNRKYFIIKVIDVSKMDNKQKNDALNEVNVLKEMRHPFIVAYRESFMFNKCLCIVMDYADAGDLYSRIAQHKKDNSPFEESQILDWFVKIALAIKHIHDKKILHRDLKTQNIFLTSSGDVKVGDFGIARVLQHTYDCAKTAIGTPYYLSPEICQEKPYNQKSDIWSLGCILYEMLTLKHAFDSTSIKGLVLKILKGVYPPISAKYSENIRNLVAEMLIKDPNKRPSIKKILEKEFIKEKIQKIFEEAMKKQESNGIKSKSKLDYESKNEEDISQKSSDEHNFPIASDQNRKEMFKKLHQDSHHEINVLSLLAYTKHAFCEKGDGKSQIVTIYERKQRRREIYQAATFNDEDLNDLLNSLKKVLCAKEGDDDETFIEDDNQRVYARFLTPEGKEIPGTSVGDSIGYRIEALRVYLEKQFGEFIFLKIYKMLLDETDKDEATEEAQKLLGDNSKFLGLVIQLLVCEENYYK